jgi:hypothetical protein
MVRISKNFNEMLQIKKSKMILMQINRTKLNYFEAIQINYSKIYS